jgi:hypothetical protein
MRDISSVEITFSYKDCRSGGTKKEWTLSSGEFLRRFCLHIRPHGYMKIRHYGMLGSCKKPQLKAIKETPT